MCHSHDDPTVTCPSCNGAKLAKNGKTSEGLQQYLCLDGRGVGCRRQFIAGAHHINSDTKEIVRLLLLEKVKPRTIKKALPGISLSSIYRLKQELR